MAVVQVALQVCNQVSTARELLPTIGLILLLGRVVNKLFNLFDWLPCPGVSNLHATLTLVSLVPLVIGLGKQVQKELLIGRN